MILRSITPALIHALFASKAAGEIKQIFGFDNVGYEYAKEMHLRGMESHRISLYFFLLVDKQTQLPIGECGLYTWNKTHRRVDFFYSKRSFKYRQQGLITEALKTVLDYGFTYTELHRVEALVDDYNSPSVKLLQRFGFNVEGVVREDYCVDEVNEEPDCYLLSKREWGKPHLNP